MKFEVFVMVRVFVDAGKAPELAQAAALDAVEQAAQDDLRSVIDSKVIHMRRLDDGAKSEDLI